MAKRKYNPILKEIYLISEEELATQNIEQPVVDNQEQPADNLVITSQDERKMDQMEDALEKEINNSLYIDEGKKNNRQLRTLFTEANNKGGFEYEQRIVSSILAAGVAGNVQKAAGADANLPDADIKINGQIFNVEVKNSSDAQMGGSSIRYVPGGEVFLVEEQDDKAIEALIITAVESKRAEIEAMLRFLYKKKPAEINQRATKFPFTCTKDAWIKAQANKLLVNTKVISSLKFISDHYMKKNVYYIQIGGKGLFHLGSNPANLPVKQIDGVINLEIRSARSGSKMLSSGIAVVGGGLRVQARLVTKNKSDYNLEDPLSISKMLEDMKMMNSDTIHMPPNEVIPKKGVPTKLPRGFDIPDTDQQTV